MKHLIYIALLLATLPALAQPVNRIKLRQLQSAPDTSLQYFVSSQGDTAEWVLVSSLGGGADSTVFATLYRVDTAKTAIRAEIVAAEKWLGTELPAGNEYILANGNEFGLYNLGYFEVELDGNSYLVVSNSKFELLYISATPAKGGSVLLNDSLSYISQTESAGNRGTIGVKNGVPYMSGEESSTAFQYTFPTQSPSGALGDTSIMAFIGNGTTQTGAIFLDKDLFGGTSSGTTNSVDSIQYVTDTTGLSPIEGDAFVNSTKDTLGLYSGTGWVLFYGGGGSSIFKQENTSTAATAGTTNNYHEGNIGIGDFSGSTTAADLHLWRTDQAVARLSDSAATDTAALAWLEFYRGIATNLLGKIGYTDNTDADLYITNSLSGGGVSFGTDAIEKMRLAPSGQLTLNYYGDTTFTGTAVKYLAVTDDGAVIEVDGSSGGSGDSTAFALTQYTADGTTTVDFQSRAGGYFQIDMGSIAEDSLTFSNPQSTVVPTYRLHWQGVTANADTVTFPANVLSYAGDTLGSRELVADALIECYYDGTNYYCSDTLGASVTVASSPGGGGGQDSTVVTSTSGLIAWYNVNRETEFSDGGTIDTLHDWSGEAHHLVGIGTPTYEDQAVNSIYPVARFDGATDAFDRDSIGELASGNDFTIFAVAKNSNIEDAGIVFSTLGPTTGSDERLQLRIDTRDANKQAVFIKTDAGTQSSPYTSVPDTTIYTITIRHNFTSNGGDFDIYLNGTQNGSTFSWSYTTTTYYNLAFEVFRQIEGASYSSGDFAEMIIYNRLLSEAEADDIEGYLNSKYGHY